MINRIDLHLCNSCMACIDVCPTDVLRFDESMQKPVIRYPENCITCYNCEQECPQDCIDVSPLRKPIISITKYQESIKYGKA